MKKKNEERISLISSFSDQNKKKKLSVTIHLKHNYKQGKNKSDVTKITTSNQVKVCWNMRFLQFHTLTKHINSKCGALLSSLRKFS